MNEREQREHFKRQLTEAMNKVPLRVQHGSVQQTRDWMRTRAEADRLVKKPGATAAEMIAMISRLQ